MDKYFICLANSLKRGGRCIAGVEVNLDDNDRLAVVRSPQGSPRWIRPIDMNTEFGEIQNRTAQAIPLLSVVRLTEVETCPHHAHSEDVHFVRMEVIGSVPPSSEALNSLIDTQHDCLFYDGERAISIEQFANGDYSLMLIHARDILIVPDPSKQRAKFRMQFTYQGRSYNMPVTDPAFLNHLEERTTEEERLQDAYLTLSLGMVYEGRHHKLIAGVLFADSKSDARHAASEGLVLRRRSISRWKKCGERRLTKDERSAIRSATYTPTYKGPAIYIRWKDGTSFFLPIEDAPDMEPRESIALSTIRLITYEDDAGNTALKARIDNKGPFPHLVQLVRWLKRHFSHAISFI